jgi:lipid-A-disaccharide synthase
MDDEVVTELIQADFNTKNIKKELTKLLEPNYRKSLRNNDLLEKN